MAEELLLCCKEMHCEQNQLIGLYILKLELVKQLYLDKQGPCPRLFVAMIHC